MTLHLILCVIYCRISSRGQMEGAGLESQESSCIRYAERNGYKVLKVFRDEGVSGGLVERGGIRELFDFVDQYNKEHPGEKVEVFLADDVDRIARDYEVHIELKKKMIVRGMRLETVKQKFENTSIGKFMEGMMALNAELFRGQNTERVISRQEARLLDGYWPWDFPIGYKTEKAPGGGRILIPDEDAPIIKEALEGYANGLFVTQGEVANFLERKGVTFKRRRKSRKDDSGKVHKSTVSRILMNILYTGYLQYDKISKDKIGRLKKERHIPLMKARHEGLISLETHHKIQLKMKGKHTPTKGGIQKINPMYPLRGHLYCECCGEPLSGGESRGKKGKMYPYYTFNAKCIHKHKGIGVNRVHEALETELKMLTLEDDTHDFIKEIIKEERGKRVKDKKLGVTNIHKKMVAIEIEMDGYLTLIPKARSEVIREKYEAKIEGLELEKQKLHIAYTNEQDNNYEQTIDMAFEMIRNPYRLWNEGDDEQKRSFINVGFKNKILVTKNDKIFGTLPFTSLFLMNHTISEGNLRHLEMTGIEPVSQRYIYYITTTIVDILSKLLASR